MFFWFIDSGIQKNKNYYVQEIEKIQKKYGVDARLVYEKELFDTVEMSKQWDELIQHLKKWRQDIPELPNINFDSEPQTSFEEIKDTSPNIFVKLFSYPALQNVLKILFPTGATLELLKDHFQSMHAPTYQEAVKHIAQYLQLKK